MYFGNVDSEIDITANLGDLVPIFTYGIFIFALVVCVMIICGKVK